MHFNILPKCTLNNKYLIKSTVNKIKIKSNIPSPLRVVYSSVSQSLGCFLLHSSELLCVCASKKNGTTKLVNYFEYFSILFVLDCNFIKLI